VTKVNHALCSVAFVIYNSFWTLTSSEKGISGEV